MKKALSIFVVVVCVAGISGAIFLHQFALGIERSHRNLNELCARYTPGLPFEPEEERLRAEELGLSFSRLEERKGGFRVHILSAGMEPGLCEVRVRDGRVAWAK